MNLLSRSQQLNILFVMLLITFLSPLLTNKVLADTSDTIHPSLSVKEATIPNGVTTISGLVSDNITTPDKMKLQVVNSNGDVIDDTIIPTTDGTWSFEKAITEDVNTLFIVATDEANNSKKIPVKINTRPTIKKINLSVFLSKQSDKDGEHQPDLTKEVDLMKTDDMTRVSLDSTITVNVSDTYFINYKDLFSPILVFDNRGLGDGMVPGTISPITEDNQLVFHFTNRLSPGKTYFILYNSSDGSGNKVFPVIKKFTTVSDPVSRVKLDQQQFNSDWGQQPHGYYPNNVNTCANCHSTHTAGNTGLESKKLADEYCMACHDGTTAPKMDIAASAMKSKHDTGIILDHETKSGSCTACHDPHLTWSEENPNLLKDHYVYTHENADEINGDKVGKIDSFDQLCEKCHELNTNYYKKQAEKNYATQKPNKILHYQKFSALGETNNFDLCFSCHSDVKPRKDGAKDILQYYQDNSDPKKVSMHKITAVDGSQLDGYLPCSECHETHGSTNKLMLKTRLGHENQDTEDFLYTSGDWDAGKEREYCLKCHNGKTEIYGVTGKAIYDEKTGKALEIANPANDNAHDKDSNEACSKCHSESKSFIEAAHSPKSGKNP